VSKLRNSLVALAIASTLSACGGDDGPLGVNSGDPLEEEEIQAVFLAISEAFASINVAGPAAAGPAQATQSFNVSIEESGECPLGGSIAANGSANGTVDDVTFEFDMTYRLRMTPSGCQVETATNAITLEGAPYIQLDMDFFLSEELIDISGSQTGGIAFTSSDGRTGSCAFDVQFTSTANLSAGGGSSSTTGEVCGVSVDGLEVWSYETQ